MMWNWNKSSPMVWAFDMTWLDKGLRRRIETPYPEKRDAGLIWPDLIRDYDSLASAAWARSSASFDMTWLDKGLRLKTASSLNLVGKFPCLIWPDLIRDYDFATWSVWIPAPEWGLIWPDLIRDYDVAPRRSAGLPAGFDMTWLDKGLRRVAVMTILWLVWECLIWPDLIRDYDGQVGSYLLPLCPSLIWPDLIRDYDEFPRAEQKLEHLVWYDLTW